jgi:Peptidase C13 family
MRSVLAFAARAAIWRMTPKPPLVGLPSLLIFAVILAALRVALQFAAAGTHAPFNPYGLNAIVAWLALDIAATALLIKPPWRVTALAAMLALLIPAEFVVGVAETAAPLLSSAPSASAARALPTATPIIASLWWIGTMVAVSLSFAPQRPYAALGRAAAMWAVLVAVTVLVPQVPVFLAPDYDQHNANLWERLAARAPAHESDGEPAPENDGGAANDASGFQPAQETLLQAEVSRLAAPQRGATSIYAIGVEGWAGQDVFLKELDGGLAVLGSVLPIGKRTLRLVNHQETMESDPLANQRNFAAAVHAIGAVMDKNEDVLVLLMTSHGTQNGFALRLPDDVITELTPAEVAGTLDKEGITNRIVIVSACYAGIFMPPLVNDNTIVLTAADAKSTSFGCAAERDWTYFGDAFFRQSLRRGWTLQQAFENARVLISGWELMDRAPPSNPQAHFGPALISKLAPFFSATATANQ